MRKMYPNYQYVLATHIDREFIHNHIIINAVDFTTFHKLHSNKKSLEELRKISDELCRENGLSVIQGDDKNRRIVLKEMIDTAINKTDNFQDFVNQIQAMGVDIKIDEKLAFKGPADERFRRADTLGDAYSEIGIKQRLNGIEIDTAIGKKIYGNKVKKTSNRKRLIYAVEESLKTAVDFDDFINNLEKGGIEIKRGKHFAMKLPTAERFIRLDSLSEEYSEDMLRLYFNDKSLYFQRKSVLEQTKIGHIKTGNYNHFETMENIDIEIRMLNLLNQAGIGSFEELISTRENLEKAIAAKEEQIKYLNVKLSEKEEYKKAIRTYWRLKPINEKYKQYLNVDTKEAFEKENKKALQEFQTAVDIINRHKHPDGTLPKADEINTAIAEATEKVEHGRERLRQLKDELYKYSIIEDNLGHLGIEDKDISLVQSDENLK